ncbi:nucleoside triphosphate pyrophosphohydrolase [Streptomyces calidiresistens]|uniref:Nucleoside triphosphate pyrophosphohydrolase n=1 Tax=Streptomyces calidiresistens TaxID=1485586 RepID=A0A7W3T6I5_9ACTN|nr:nucleoside triphosphate pyrophosphohydrolase [Streptomyces calidiresistens]MBB0231703.1 nucleoside triphosphate pyrophosphohydrolase [Streptomyces calidiresistens]
MSGTHPRRSPDPDFPGDPAEPGGSGSTGPDPGRLVLLTTSHRVAAGLLSAPAWRALRGADRVLCRDPGHPLLPHLADAGISVVSAPVEGFDIGEVVDHCSGGRTVVVLAAADGETRLTDDLARRAGSGRVRMPDLELLPGSWDLPGARLLDLVEVMDRIRRDCPWSSVRTHADLAPYALEEVHELVEAIEAGDRGELREELGDVLLQVVFHARIAEEDAGEPFSIDDVAGGIVAKLIHRHPHVFGDERASTPEEVREHWLRTKATEKARGSVTEGIPMGQPALALAAKLAARARTAGLPAVPREREVPGPSGDPAEDFGQRLLALAAEAEAAGVDPESALRAAARRYRDTLREAEAGRAADAE